MISAKKRELLSYVFFGVLTTIVSFTTYTIFNRVFNFDTVPANVISWIFSVTFAYITNRIWVFNTKKTGAKEMFFEATSFYASRVFSGFVETGIMFLFIDKLGFYDIGTKLVATVIVVVLNYILSKFIVFKTKTKN